MPNQIAETAAACRQRGLSRAIGLLRIGGQVAHRSAVITAGVRTLLASAQIRAGLQAACGDTDQARRARTDELINN